MIKANDTPVWRNENIGTPTLAPVKTAAAHARRDSVAALAPSVLQAVPPRAAAYSSVNPWTCPGRSRGRCLAHSSVRVSAPEGIKRRN